MKHTYESYQDQMFEIVYTMSPRYPATQTDPAGGGEIEIEAIWLMGISPAGSERRILDINPHLRGNGDLDAIFGKYFYDHLAHQAADDISDERAAAVEHRAESRRDGGA